MYILGPRRWIPTELERGQCRGEGSSGPLDGGGGAPTMAGVSLQRPQGIWDQEAPGGIEEIRTMSYSSSKLQTNPRADSFFLRYAFAVLQ